MSSARAVDLPDTVSDIAVASCTHIGFAYHSSQIGDDHLDISRRHSTGHGLLVQVANAAPEPHDRHVPRLQTKLAHLPTQGRHVLSISYHMVVTQECGKHGKDCLLKRRACSVTYK